ncbi:MAG: DUF4339 domain-containing protein [Labilithrix sp.]|nr:DUF4339 domain-containing protein [Labilithrix sp.]
MSEWSAWFVYRVDGAPVGPLTTKAVAEAILAGKLPPDCWIAAPGGTRWLRALDVPVIATLLGGPEARRRASGLRAVTAPIPASHGTRAPIDAPRDATPAKLDETLDLRERGDDHALRSGRHDDTVKTTRSPSPSPSPPTVRSVEPRGPDGFPIPPPPSSSTPPSGYRRGAETLESPAMSPFEPMPRKRTQGA